MKVTKIGVASDHAGFEMKEAMRKYLAELLPEVVVVDYGTFSSERADYPDFGHKLGEAIDKGEVEYGVASCGSAVGISMTLNRHKKVRAALSWCEEIAKLSRQHNDANVLCIPGRFATEEEGRAMVRAFFSTDFEGGRHTARVEKI